MTGRTATIDTTGSDARAASGVTRSTGIAALLPFTVGRRGRLVAASLIACVAALAELVPFYAVARGIDVLVTGGTYGDVDRWAWVAAGAVVVRFVATGVAMWISHVAAYGLLYQLRISMAERMAQLPLGWFSRRRTGEIKKVMADDAERLEIFLAHGIPDLVAALAVTAGTTAWLFIVDWRMGLATVVPVLAALVCMRRAERAVQGSLVGYHEALASMNGSIVELVRGMPVVKAFNRGDQAFTETRQAIDDYVQAVDGYSRAFLRGGSAFFALVVGSVFVAVPVGLVLWQTGHLSASTLLFFFVIGLGYGIPVLRLFNLFGNLGHLSFGGNLVHEILHADRLEPDGAPAAVELREHGIEFDVVTFAYEHGPLAVDDVSFTAPAGGITALVGPSGSGKTTIARLVARFWDVDSGAVRIGGVDVRDIPLTQLMATVAFVFQETFLFADTIEANLRVARPDATVEELESAARAAHAHDFISNLPDGYQTAVGERGSLLSGGQRQRLAIARALLADAPVLVLDEATAFADPESEAAIQAGLGNLVAGRTVLMIAHRLSTIVGADQIIVVDGGRIAERGTHHELVGAESLYRRLWDDFSHIETLALGDAVRQETP